MTSKLNGDREIELQKLKNYKNQFFVNQRITKPNLGIYPTSPGKVLILYKFELFLSNCNHEQFYSLLCVCVCVCEHRS